VPKRQDPTKIEPSLSNLLSIHTNQSIIMDNLENRLLDAIDAFNRGEFKSKRAAASHFDVPYRLFVNRHAGRRTRQEKEAPNKRLTDEEEQAVINFMLSLDSNEIRGTARTIETTAMHLLNRRPRSQSDPDPAPLGNTWVSRFMARHANELMFQRDSPKELDRAAAEDPVAIKSWFDKLKGKIDRCGIQRRDIYNVDEAGFRIGIGRRERVVTKRRKTKVRLSSSKDTDRELITMVETVSADGDVLPPLAILQSKSPKLMEDWVKNTTLPGEYCLDTSESAYINDEIALKWIRHFDKWSKKRQIGEWRLLLLDGHNSHHTFEFLSYARDNKILLYFLIPHCSQLLQPLDVAVFQPYKHWHGVAVGDHNRMGLTAMTKSDFLDNIRTVRQRTFKPGTVKKAFHDSGIWPWNPDAVLRQIVPKDQTPECEPAEDFHSTPKTTQELQKLAKSLSQDLITAIDAFRKTEKALQSAYIEIHLLNQQLDSMNAARHRKAELNKSKRQVNHPIGEPSDFDVASARHAVQARLEAEREKAKRKAEREAAKAAKRQKVAH
jgi:hypothetical protein